ncbi:hypothetical protein ABK040_014437 [Willaertia magna]
MHPLLYVSLLTCSSFITFNHEILHSLPYSHVLNCTPNTTAEDLNIFFISPPQKLTSPTTTTSTPIGNNNNLHNSSTLPLFSSTNLTFVDVNNHPLTTITSSSPPLNRSSPIHLQQIQQKHKRSMSNVVKEEFLHHSPSPSLTINNNPIVSLTKLSSQSLSLSLQKNRFLQIPPLSSSSTLNNTSSSVPNHFNSTMNSSSSSSLQSPKGNFPQQHYVGHHSKNILSFDERYLNLFNNNTLQQDIYKGNEMVLTTNLENNEMNQFKIFILNNFKNLNKKIQFLLLEILKFKKIYFNNKLFELNFKFIIVIDTLELPYKILNEFIGFVPSLLNGIEDSNEEKEYENLILNIKHVFNNQISKNNLLNCIDVSIKIKQYIRDIVISCRNHPYIVRYPTSETIDCVISAAKAYALIWNKSFVTPTHVQAIVPNILYHRMECNESDRWSVIADILSYLPPP